MSCNFPIIDLVMTQSSQGQPLLFDFDDLCMKIHVTVFKVLNNIVIFDLKEPHAILQCQGKQCSRNGAEIAIANLSTSSILHYLYQNGCTSQDAVPFRAINQSSRPVWRGWCLLHKNSEPGESSGPIRQAIANLETHQIYIYLNDPTSDLLQKINSLLTELFSSLETQPLQENL